MQRIWNEMTSSRRRKAMYGYGGVKMGDFGSGGRVYEKDYVVKKGTSQGCTPQSCGILSCLCLSIPLIALIMTERTLYLTAGCIEEAGESAIQCDSPYVIDQNEGALIFATSDPRHQPTLNGKPPKDEYFNFEFDSDHGIGKRVTEYCQWSEMRHSRSKDTGRKDDKGNSIYTQEVWYTYHKAWRKHRIQSLVFDNPVAYNNPQRDPAPSKTIASHEGIDISGKASPVRGLSISSQDMEPAMQPWKHLYITKDHTTAGVSHDAKNNGFSEADHMYFYSRKPKGGWDSPLFQAGMSYLVDGILDVNSISSATGLESLLGKAGLGWITKGTCDAGDIRVHFEGKKLPKSVSVAGQQIGGTIVPMRYSNGASMLIIKSGIMNLESLLKLTLSDANFWQNVYRGIIFLLVIFGGIFFENASNFISPDWKLGVGLGSTFFSFIFGCSSVFFYGFDDSLIPIGMLVGSIALLGIYIATGDGGKTKSE